MKMTKGQIVYSMCETWLPGFSNLHAQEKEYIYNKMFEVYTKCVEPNMTTEQNNGYVTVGKLLGILDEYDKRFYELEHRLDAMQSPTKPMMTTTGYPWNVTMIGSDGC